MYGVSADYINAIKQPAIRSRVTGTIAGVPFGDGNILEGSFSITNQNSGNENVQIGTVFIGELSITLRGLDLNRYTLNNMEIVPYFELLLEDGATWESVPLGRFYVGEAKHTAAGIVIKAYDVMSKFDKRCTGAAVTGTPYQLAKLACDACFVTLATDQATFSGFANGEKVLGLWQDGTDIETWRDFLSWVAQACGCYATSNRFGQIEFRPYTQDVVDVVDPTGRFKGASYSDYETRYTGIYVTNIEDSTMDYYGLPQDDGLTYSLGQNPFLQYGTNEAKETIRRAILNKLALICYVPFSVTLAENPAYDLGDVLSFPGGLGDGDKLFCVNKYTWSYHKGITLEGVGENPALASAQSKTDKNIAGLLSKINDDRMHYYDFLNAADLVIRNGETEEIINLRFVTTKDTHVDFHAELRALIETLEEVDGDEYTEHDVTGIVTYYLNDELIAYNPIFTEFDGIQLRHLLYFWQTSANVIGTFRVTLTARGGDITIPAGHLHAYWAGEGLVGDDAWDGTVHITDDVSPIDLYDLMVGSFTDSVSVVFSEAKDYTAGDTIGGVDLYDYLISAFTDKVGTISKLHRFDVPYSSGVMAYDNTAADGSVWKVTGDYDTGTLTTPNVSVGKILRITSRHSGDDVAYIVSFDSGATWWTYADSWAEPDYTQDVYGMFEGTMRSISSAAWAEKYTGSVMVRMILTGAATVTDIQIYEEDISE